VNPDPMHVLPASVRVSFLKGLRFLSFPGSLNSFLISFTVSHGCKLKVS